MLVGFVSGGLMSLSQAIGILLGTLCFYVSLGVWRDLWFAVTVIERAERLIPFHCCCSFRGGCWNYPFRTDCGISDKSILFVDSGVWVYPSCAKEAKAQTRALRTHWYMFKLISSG